MKEFEEAIITVPENFSHDFNLDLKSMLMEEIELEEGANETIEKFREGGEMFKVAKSNAQRLFPGTIPSVKAIIDQEAELTYRGLDITKLRQRDWNWLFRMTEKIGDASAMHYVWKKAPDGAFKSSWSVRERLATALLYKASDQMELGRQETASWHHSKSFSIISQLQEEGDQSSRLMKYLGNEALFRAGVFKRKNMEEAAEIKIREAISHYKEGFMKDFDTNTGLKLVRTMLKHGTEKRDFEEIEEALRIAQLTEICTNRDGSRWSNDTNVLLNVLEAAIFNGRDFEFITTVFKKLDKLSVDDDDIKTIKKLEELSEIFSKLAEADPEKKTWAESVVSLNNIMIYHKPELYEKSRKTKAQIDRELYTQNIFNAGVQFKHLYPIWISGNIKSGGILPSTMISDADREFVRILLQKWRADKTDNFFIVDKILDEEMELQFEGRKMEKIGNQEQEDYKYRMYKLLRLTKARKDGDATTNISVFYELGLGDCRAISTAYQHFYDVWWKDRINTHLRSAMDSIGNPETFEESIYKAKTLLKRQSLLLNFKGIANIQSDNGNLKVDPKTELFVKADTDQEAAKHTMPVDLILDDDLVVSEIHFNDPLGWAHRLDGDGSNEPSTGFSAYQITKGLLEVGQIDVIDEESGIISKTPVYYSLDYEVKDNLKVFPEMTDYGDRYFMGIPLSGVM